ncbi:hypothetical protein A4X13_0g4689 [Tilletia indica]|uniref:F-box domain-containing protein n=1 Tax=Tilletia indica TaxID=43049 RepID=A0A177TSH6_9BASI|nr:hypothetical protein A4X13_0g4689 [Tilletia indica]
MQQVHYLASIDRRWRTAVHLFLSRHFLMIEAATSSVPSRWLPGTTPDPGAHASYWSEAIGPDWDDVKSLRFQLGWLRRIDATSIKALSLDLRVVSIDTIGTARTWNDTQSGQWVLSSAVLSRIAGSCTRLESVHIRISPHEDQFDLLQDIITKNPLLRDVVVEVDSALDAPPTPPSVLSVGNWFWGGQGPAQLDRLVVRAPSCEISVWDDEPLFGRLATATEVRIAALTLQVVGDPLQWVTQLARSAPLLRKLEIAATRGGRSSSSRSPVGGSPSTDPIALSYLTHLALDLPAVDARLLRAIIAPELQELYIQTRERMDAFGTVPPLHFPNLSFIKTGCSCSIVRRLEVLGLPRASYSHLLTSIENEHRDFDGDFNARIRPDQRAADMPRGLRRNPTSSPPGSLWLHSPRSDTSLVLLSPTGSASSPTAACQHSGATPPSESPTHQPESPSERASHASSSGMSGSLPRGSKRQRSIH